MTEMLCRFRAPPGHQKQEGSLAIEGVDFIAELEAQVIRSTMPQCFSRPSSPALFRRGLAGEERKFIRDRQWVSIVQRRGR